MHKRTWVAAAMLVISFLAAACVNQAAGTSTGTRSSTDEPGRAKSPKPNIVFILADDLSWNMVKYMSEVQRMRRNGTTFTNYYAADSLCCPSRANIFTGRYPHNTGVRVNENHRGGGHQAFVRNGNEKRTYAVELDRAGYQTAHLGKYINQYKIARSAVPPGWDRWYIGDSSYSNVAGSYRMSGVGHKGARRMITRPDSYLNDLLGKRTRQLADAAHRGGDPFFAQLSSFTPHHRLGGKGHEPRFPAAERDRPSVGWPGGQFPHGDCGTRPDGRRYDCRDLKVPRGTGFDKVTYRKLDQFYQNRVQMVQSLNDQVKALRKQLARNGQLSNTYFVFSSDNGYHLGEHGLMRGKGSAYDHDTRVPLIVQGPGVRKGAVRTELTQTVDLYPTFQELAGLKPQPSDGRSLAGLLQGEPARDWRRGVLFEHRAQEQNPVARRDPDLDGDVATSARAHFVPAFHSYNAIRTEEWLYVEYLDTRRRELYDLRRDPGQHRNVARRNPAEARRLSRWLAEYTTCAEGRTPCQRADRNRS